MFGSTTRGGREKLVLAPQPSPLLHRWEHKKVMKMVRAIRKGWIKPKSKKEEPKFYDIWEQETSDKILKRHAMHISAPKLTLPGHEESYNPPAE